MRPLAVVGVIAVAGGFLVLVDQGLAGALDLSSVVVTLIGVLGILQGVRYASARRGRDRRSADLGEPERREPAAVPGAELDATIARAAASRRRGRSARTDVRSRVRSMAVRAVARERNCSQDHAAELVETGAWTDDGRAAAFLSPATTYSVRDQLRGGLPGRSTFRLGLTAAVDAVERAMTGAAGRAAATDSDAAAADGEGGDR